MKEALQSQVTDRRFHQVVDDLHEWRMQAIPEEHRTIGREFKRATEEFIEAGVEVTLFDGTPESREKVIGECGDTIVGLMGTIMSAGGDPITVLEAIVARMFDKYPPDEIQKRMTGPYAEPNVVMEWPTVMADLKQEYKNGH